jgi:SAM-dependent methyltransferase
MKTGIEFVCSDITKPLDSLGKFDFIWMRFVLEYFHPMPLRYEQFVRHFEPGGTLCLIDLDYNCLSHYGLPGKWRRLV